MRHIAKKKGKLKKPLNEFQKPILEDHHTPQTQIKSTTTHRSRIQSTTQDQKEREQVRVGSSTSHWKAAPEKAAQSGRHPRTALQ